MTWAHPGWLPALVLVPVVAALVILAWRRRRVELARIASVDALATLVPPRAAVARGWQSVLGVIAVAALLIAAAGPRLGFDWEQRKLEGIAIVAVLDVSRSMDAMDVTPSRLERARRELYDLANLLKGDQIGLVLFAAGAWTRIPLTVDYGTFIWAVGDSSSQTIRAQGSELSGAITVATRSLGRAPGTGKALLLVSDGEIHEDTASVDAAVARAVEAGVRVYALGIGTPEGAPVPLPEGGFKKDDAGNVVMSKLGEDRLRTLAETTGGAYVRAVTSDADVRALYEDEMRGKLQASSSGVRRDQVWRERFQWPLAIGLLVLVVRAGLGIGRLAVLVLLVPLAARAGTVEDGMEAYTAEKWEDAARLLGQARVEDPDDPSITSALASALHRSGRYREAEQMFRTLAGQTEDPAQQAIGYYNAGNAAYSDGRLDDAKVYFDESVKRAPEFGSATKNAEATAREIQARLNPQPPPPPQDGGGDPPQDGEPQEPPPPGEQEPQPTEGGEEPATGEPPGQEPQPGDAPEGEGDETPVEVSEGSPGAMTPEQAARVVDSVPEGKPRVSVPGRSTGKDW